MYCTNHTVYQTVNASTGHPDPYLFFWGRSAEENGITE